MIETATSVDQVVPSGAVWSVIVAVPVGAVPQAATAEMQVTAVGR